MNIFIKTTEFGGRKFQIENKEWKRKGEQEEAQQ